MKKNFFLKTDIYEVKFNKSFHEIQKIKLEMEQNKMRFQNLEM